MIGRTDTAGVQLLLPEGWVQPWWHTTSPPQPNAAQAGRRSWTLLGTADGSQLAAVDRCGLVSTSAGWAEGNWSLDWWIKAGEQWLFPSQRRGIRQRLLEGAPVVETVIRVGGAGVGSGAGSGSRAGGEICQRVFVARPANNNQEPRPGLGQISATSSDQLVVEISNASNSPVAVALAVRPYDLQGIGRLHALSVVDQTVLLGSSNAPNTAGVASGMASEIANAGGEAGVGLSDATEGVPILLADRSPGEVVFGSGGIDPGVLLTNNTPANPSGETPAGKDPSGSPAGEGASKSDNEPVNGFANKQGAPPNGQNRSSVQCSSGLASVALVFPLVHGTVLRAITPLMPASSPSLPANTDSPAGRKKKRNLKTSAESSDSKRAAKQAKAVKRRKEKPDRSKTSTSSSTVDVSNWSSLSIFAGIPAADKVASGWRKQSEAALGVQLPNGQLAQAFQAAKTALPLAVRGGAVSAAPLGPNSSIDDDALVLAALAEAGHAASVSDVLIERGKLLGRRGDIQSTDGQDLTAATLTSAAQLLALHPDDKLAETFGEIAAAGARWLLAQLDRRKSSFRKPRPVPNTAEQDAELWEGLRAAERLLELAEAKKALKHLRLSTEALRTKQKKSAAKEPTQAKTVSQVDPAQADPGSEDDSSTKANTMVGLLIADVSGGGTHLLETARQALAEVRYGQVVGSRRLEALVNAATSTWSWPTTFNPLAHLSGAHHPSSPAGLGASATGSTAGHDLRVTALLVRCVRSMLLNDSTPGALSLAHIWPEAWLGAEVEVHNMAADGAQVSWAVRWHGQKPALLWEIKPHAQQAFTLTAPGLDPEFASAELVGEKLLSV